MICMVMLTGCKEVQSEETELQVFVAASLKQSMEKVVEQYKEKRPDVSIVLQADSSGTLMTQIEEGYACDIFFSAAEKQVDQLEEDGHMVAGSRVDVLKNQVVLIKEKDTDIKVGGLKNLGEAKSIALAASSVPVGNYTRTALQNLGMLDANLPSREITTKQVSDALGGVEISEQSNVSKVLIAVEEGSCEVGTVYLSDTYGHENRIDIIEKIPESLTGPVVYPACLIKNDDADEKQMKEAKDFFDYMVGDEAKEIFANHAFQIND